VPAVAIIAAGVAGHVRADIYLSGAAVLAVAFAVGLLNWRWAVYGLVLYIPVSGIPILAMYPHTKVAVLAKDFLFVLPCYAGFAAEAILRRRRVSYDGAPTVLLAAFALLVVVEAINPRNGNLLVGLIGVKVYLLYVPLLYVGYRLVETREDLRRLLFVLVVPAILPCVIGILEAALIYGGHSATVDSFYGPAASAATQSFFSSSIGAIGGATLSRVPSIFSYGGQYYFYTIAMIAIAYAYLRGPLRHSRLHWAGWALLILVSAASLLSGSRGAFLLAPALLAIILLLDRVGAPRLVMAALSCAAAFLLALSLIGTQLGSAVSASTSDGAANAQIILRWIPKALHLTLIGLGTGVDTEGARYAFDARHAAEAHKLLGFVWIETWWLKIFLELGIAGVALVVALLGKLIGGAIAGHLRVSDPELRSISAALLAFLIWNVVYGLKSQQVDLDPTDVYFWLFAGVLARVQALDREARAAPAAGDVWSGPDPAPRAGPATRAGPAPRAGKAWSRPAAPARRAEPATPAIPSG
jgi:hypothetical protein